MPQTIFPILRYENARAAIGWLETVFGFELVFSVPPTGETVRHARLMLVDNIIMVGSSRAEEAHFKSPLILKAMTQALCVFVPDVKAHFQQAKAAGAEIVSPLEVTDFGSQEYHVHDCEGHLWIFTSPVELPD